VGFGDLGELLQGFLQSFLCLHRQSSPKCRRVSFHLRLLGPLCLRLDGPLRDDYHKGSPLVLCSYQFLIITKVVL
jgi:hypothetical protein